MISAVKTIALVTFKEAIRDRILLVLLVFGLLLLGTTLFLGSISLDQDSKIIVDLGLFGIFLFGAIITLFLGGASVVKELDQRTAYTTLTRPIARSWFIIGKFFGLAITLLLLTTAMSLMLCALMAFRLGWHSVDAALLLALFYTYLEFCVLTALTLFFSSFSSAIMSTVYTLALLIIAHSSGTVVNLINSAHSGTRYFFTVVYYILPNFTKFNLRNDVVYHLQPHAGEVGLTVLYAAIYSSLLLILASAVFKKQEL